MYAQYSSAVGWSLASVVESEVGERRQVLTRHQSAAVIAFIQERAANAYLRFQYGHLTSQACRGDNVRTRDHLGLRR